MCGRYAVLTENEISEVFPTNNAPVITDFKQGKMSFENLRWGFKRWDGSGVIINARSETIKTKSMFARLLEAGRCVVPANEYYEWKKQGRDKIKHFIKDKEGNMLFMAGLYKEGSEGREFVIITKTAYGAAADIHSRMPVILKADQVEGWLNGALGSEDISKLEFDTQTEPCEDMQLSLF